MVPGLVIAAPASGSGKTVLTLGLLRLLARSGVRVASFKAGPDYIDPAFHEEASGRPCINLDPWAMGTEKLRRLASEWSSGADIAICEGVMGLFDGAGLAKGSTADLAAALGWPVVLVIDARSQAASAAAVLRGFACHRPDVAISGVIFNRVAGMRHGEIIRHAVGESLPHIPVLGCIPRHENLNLPGRHLGLVQALEHPDLEDFIDTAARLVGEEVDVQTMISLAQPPLPLCGQENLLPPIPPLGQRIAVANDEAFSFRYPHVIEGWRGAGAEVSFFSPTGGQGPKPDCDAVYLPGGYPELHAGALAGNGGLEAIRAAVARGVVVFGECGGFMVLGRGLVDAGGGRHAMAGLLPLETSFAERGLHLGYRAVTLAVDCPLGAADSLFMGHEFHYATVSWQGEGKPLFHCRDAMNHDLGPAGLVMGRVMGSFVHIIDRGGND